LKEQRRSSQFKKDYKKAIKQRKDISLLEDVVNKLAKGESLSPALKDHSLSGNLKEYRALHLEPDWLLIYKVTTSELLLARLGSHSEIY
jgi:mRNA interferase YafQ